MPDPHLPERRLTFGRVAEVYEQIRPSYPAAMVEEVIAHAQLERGDRVLDVGAGTGKATRLFANRGQQIVALEPSAQMAAVARSALADLDDVTLVQSEFESWKAPAAPFKLVISAQAWHWIDPEVRYAKARAVLRTGGSLAAFWNHADWQATPLRAALDEAYRRAAPAFAATGPMHPRTSDRDMVPDWEAEIAAAEGFEQPLVRRFPWRARYSVDQYLRLLSTHSDHIMLEPSVRARLLVLVGEAIEAHGGELEMSYVTRLTLARAA